MIEETGEIKQEQKKRERKEAQQSPKFAKKGQRVEKKCGVQKEEINEQKDREGLKIWRRKSEKMGEKEKNTAMSE